MQTSSIQQSQPQRQRQTIPFYKRIGVFMSPFLIFGVLLPLLIYTIMMEALGWPSPLVGLRGVVAYFAPTSTRVVLYSSPTTRSYFSKIGGNYDTLLTPWKLYFQSRNREVTEIDDISKLRGLSNGVLILPSTVAIGEGERAEIAAFRKRGGSVLTTWAAGTRNGNGDWEGWQFLETLGVKTVGEVPAESESRQLILTGESPLSHTNLSGQRIWMSKTSESLLRFKGERVAARFMNWARVIEDANRDEGAVVYSETASSSLSSSRTVSFAFAETAWESHPFVAYGLIDDTLKWLLRESVVVKSAWPGAKQFAQVIEMDTEEGFPNALPFGNLLRSTLDYRPTFYVLTSVAKEFPEVVTQLAKGFEIAYHGDVHDSFKGQPAPLQEQRIMNMQQQLAAVMPDAKRVTGFRAPTEGYNATTERLLQKHGIRHHAVDPQRTEGRIPEFLKQEDVELVDSIVLLPRSQRDDINFSRENLNVEQTAKALIDDFGLAMETGALGWLSVHSQNFKPDDVLFKATPIFLDHVKKNKDSTWLATAGQVADWWRERDRFKISYKQLGQRLEFNVTVTGNKPVSGGSLTLMLPQKGVFATVRALKIGMKEPEVRKIDEYRSAIVFSTLEPGNYAYLVTFSLIN
jgi:peptidoglycan/xylan/chitin deacetylase (PgdA/CDA1 family)